MKTLTCSELGGTCETTLTAASWEDMVQTMTKHVMAKHPDVAKKMEAMHNADPARWSRETKPKWDAAPEVAAAHA
jgi:predicted small metal-binding protein